MQLDYLMIYNDFFTKKSSYSEFIKKIDEYINAINPQELTLFYNYITDNSFQEYNPDMVMLTYLHLWLFPNRLNRLEIISGADNIYLTFIKSILDYYPSDFSKPVETLKTTLNYQIYKRGNIIIILNNTETDITFPVPEIIKNGTHYCINCGDEIFIKESLQIYPYGFYIIEKL